MSDGSQSTSQIPAWANEVFVIDRQVMGGLRLVAVSKWSMLAEFDQVSLTPIELPLAESLGKGTKADTSFDGTLLPNRFIDVTV